MRIELDIHSNDNALFVTNQCDNRCVMCSQPPSKDDDIDFLFERNLQVIDNAPEGLTEIGITGGEPTLLKDKLFLLIEHVQERFPNIGIHLLTNGRAFADIRFACMFSSIENILFGIPIHSDYSDDHDAITLAKGSYTETMKGLYNLARGGNEIELRVVIHRMNYTRLYRLSEFIWKNLPFVAHISFMGMETTGYSIKNREKVWIDPFDYRHELERSVMNLAEWGLNVSVFNIPHCLLPSSLHPFARKSISDWKVHYLDDCTDCSKKAECCGLFSTSKIHSNCLRPLREQTIPTHFIHL